MSERELGQLSLADALVSGIGVNETLDRLEELIDWTALGRLLSPVHGSRLGAPGYPAVAMAKALLLQQWNMLSDPGLEAALDDRISFRRFCGFALADRTPDHVTIHRFRETLRRHDLANALFEEIARQIDAYGLIVRQGTLIDASLVEAAVQRPPRPRTHEAPVHDAGDAAPADDGALQDPAAPAAPQIASRPPSQLVASLTDPQAAWSRKGGRRSFGYKAHVGVDQGSGIIRRQCLTPGNVNDTVPADALICGDEKAVYADQAYTTRLRRDALKARGTKDRMMHRANKHHPLTSRQIAHNEAIGRRRAPVEQVFARLKCHLGWRRVRYLGLARNAVHLALMCTALNLKRLVTLSSAGHA